MNLDFALILVVVTLVTGLLWLLDIAFFAPSRKQKESQMVEEGFEEPTVNKPYWAELSSSIFPVLAAVLILRSFLYD
jgi:signal peptidase I